MCQELWSLPSKQSTISSSRNHTVGNATSHWPRRVFFCPYKVEFNLIEIRLRDEIKFDRTAIAAAMQGRSSINGVGPLSIHGIHFCTSAPLRKMLFSIMKGLCHQGTAGVTFRPLNDWGHWKKNIAREA